MLLRRLQGGLRLKTFQAPCIGGPGGSFWKAQPRALSRACIDAQGGSDKGKGPLVLAEELGGRAGRAWGAFTPGRLHDITSPFTACQAVVSVLHMC